MRNWILRFLLAVKILAAESLIVRLPCKQYGNFSVTQHGYVLQGSVISTFNFLTQQECKFECLMNVWCKSINIENDGDEKCELNDKTPTDIKDNVTLSMKSGWTFITTSYSEPLVGDNCKKHNPCRKGVLCKDTCFCPGYKCYPCSHGQSGLHCYDSENIGCNVHLTTADGSITSPGFPADYGNNHNCTYSITVEHGKVIRLVFAQFSLEHYGNNGTCLFDYLQIMDGSSEGTRYCGDNIPVPAQFTSKDNWLVMNFVTDDSITDKGFFITYVTMNKI